MANVVLKNIGKVYPGGTQAVYDLDLEIGDRELLVITGPSGCGKSTVLRMIAGLEDITSGELFIDGKPMNDVPPKDRDLSMVFQNYALYPHMTVYENMAFGLTLRKVPKEVIDARVKEAAAILGLSEFLSRKPKTLNGGQRQRVVLGRTIVREPKVFLLDEPLSHLDAKLRAQMRAEISKLHLRLGTTFVYVTHDQTEALTMGSRVVVMKDGFMQQADTPQNLYDYPVNLFVAGFFGSPQMNFLRGVKISEENGAIFALLPGGYKLPLPEEVVCRFGDLEKYRNTETPLTLGIRPEDVRIDAASESGAEATVEVTESLGSETLVHFDLDDRKEKTIVDSGAQIVARMPSHTELQVGDTVRLGFDMRHIHFFDEETELAVLGRDSGYEAIPENREAAYIPPTPAEMRARAEAARPAKTKQAKKGARRSADEEQPKEEEDGSL